MSDGSDGKKKRGLTPEQWVEVRKQYEAGASVASLSKKYRTRRNTIADRAKREAWTVQPTVQVGGAEAQRVAQRKVIDMVTRDAITSERGQAAVAAVTDAAVEYAEELLATVSASRKAAQYANMILDLALAGGIAPANMPGEQNEAQVAKDVMSMYRTFISTVRENSGIRPGSPSIGTTEDDGVANVIEFVVPQLPTGTDDK